MGKGRAAGRVGSDFLSAIAGRVGSGRVNGETGMRGYCHAMPILIDRFGGKELPSGYPYTQKKAEGMKKLMNFLWNTPVGRWLS